MLKRVRESHSKAHVQTHGTKKKKKQRLKENLARKWNGADGVGQLFIVRLDLSG